MTERSQDSRQSDADQKMPPVEATAPKKPWVTPEVQRHKAAAVVSGSSDDSCYYSHKNLGSTYYH